MRPVRVFLLLTGCCSLVAFVRSADPSRPTHGVHMRETDAKPWNDLPALPEALAGQCVGTSSGWLLVTGGSMWTTQPWNGGVKVWSDAVYGLRSASEGWKRLGTLPHAVGYGAGVQSGNALVCAGGQNATEVFQDVFTLTVDADGVLHQATLPALPQPLTNAAAAIAGGRLLLVGGQTSLTPQGTALHALQLDLASPQHWSTLETPWSHARILPAVAGCDNTVWVGGGADLSQAVDGTAQRQYLTDAWRFDTVQSKWSRLHDLPAPVTAAPSACTESGHWQIYGGDDGSLARRIQQLRDNHPGFRRTVLQYDSSHDHWEQAGELPLSLVTTGAARWRNQIVIAGGENQPGHRSTRVIARPVK